MATAELENAKLAISLSDLQEVAELAFALRTRLRTLGASLETISFGPEPMPGQAETWEEIEADFARHDAGERGFSLEEMRNFSRSSTD